MAHSMETQSDLLKEKHLAHLLDEMMASQKVTRMAFLLAKSLEYLLAHSMVLQTALLMVRHWARPSDETMASQREL